MYCIGDKELKKVRKEECKMFETSRLIIRRFMPYDWHDLYEYLSDEKVVEYEPYGVLTEKKCKEEAINRSKDEAFWAVCLKDTQKLIGSISLFKKDFDTLELGYVFNSNFHGNGYATEAAKELVNYAFTVQQVRRVIAMCDPENKSSWKLLERLKMRREAHFIQNIYFKKDKDKQPIWKDTYEYAILFTEWQQNFI